jgi:xanthine dehydrogenase accessory factor
MIWEFINGKLSRGISVVLMVVMESRGSSPGRPGFKMAVSDDGEWEGSIGGGVMEFELLSKVRSGVVHAGKVEMQNLVHDDKAGSDHSGMICAGSQRVALIRLTKADQQMIDQIIVEKTGRLVLREWGLSFHPSDNVDLPVSPVFQGEEPWIYKEAVGLDPQLIIFGGGHIGLALSKLFADLGFRITVLDNRDDQLKTIQENRFADEIRIIDFSDADKQVPDGPNIYVVIATSSHEFDGLILDQLLGKWIPYIGMLGSRKKVEYIKRTLSRTGWANEDLDRVDAPIGIQIDSETPMEIAVSIAARIIQVKNRKRKG